MISSQDSAVQIKLVIMYAIGTLVMLTLLTLLIHKQGHWFSKFTTPLMVITLFMITVLIDTITLP